MPHATSRQSEVAEVGAEQVDKLFGERRDHGFPWKTLTRQVFGVFTVMNVGIDVGTDLGCLEPISTLTGRVRRLDPQCRTRHRRREGRLVTCRLRRPRAPTRDRRKGPSVASRLFKHNRSGMVAVLGPFWALPCYIYIYASRLRSQSERHETWDCCFQHSDYTDGRKGDHWN
jgi:hypothetical protein